MVSVRITSMVNSSGRVEIIFDLTRIIPESVRDAARATVDTLIGEGMVYRTLYVEFPDFINTAMVKGNDTEKIFKRFDELFKDYISKIQVRTYVVCAIETTQNLASGKIEDDIDVPSFLRRQRERLFGK